ncbi:MAG: 23S rRNA (adenine(2503)-C(2))-methyltransferase RlmN [Rickettsiales bacterium]|jgi:23S rRNA (adenine2503-C2)-methyltransferase|nr:23S rRNA (adenine(2503)-C(2))-methyltransferase RlmN [Rickettsiales bacterium]
MEKLYDKSLPELQKIMAGFGDPPFRAKQMREWLDRGAPDFSVIKNMPAPLLQKLAESFQTLHVRDHGVIHSADGETSKFLFLLDDGEKVESVLMRSTYGNSVCVSSQAGCAMGCKFCASTIGGFRRNLTADEMFAEVLRCQWELRQGSGTAANGDKKQNDVSHVVIMGVGEPLLNFDNAINFIKMLHDRLKIGYRRITLSTCGIVPGIRRLKEFGQPVNLAVSLHAPGDGLRRSIMPVAEKYLIAEILDAGFEFSALHNRQLMIEYLLLGGINDSPEHAEALANLLKGRLAMVNLIPWNAVAESSFRAPSGNAAHRFLDELVRRGIHARIRKERGADIGSACGQLRAI